MTQRIILITGGSEGMGLAAAERFHAMGDQVVITGRSHEKMNKVSSRHSGIHTIVSDISCPDDRVRLFADIREHFGHIDVFFANAGLGLFKPFADISEEDFDFIADVNYKGLFFSLQGALGLMPHRSKIIVNASWTHHRALEGASLYSSTKAAARYLVKALAHELAVRKINVNAISPGLINTAQFNEEMIGQKASNDHKMRIPAARFGEPDDIAGVVAFLASDEAEYINGQEIIIDGGLTSVH
tara:strand:- start:273 stop:1001 length:729 start_codon:yes stop_codon:yes gene_type:complete